MMGNLRRAFACLSLAVACTSVSAQVTVSPASINFFTVFKGQPDSVALTISNTKPSGNLDVTGLRFHHGDAFYVKEGGFSVAPGNSHTVWVYCNPRHNVRYLDWLMVETSSEAVVPAVFVGVQGKYSNTYYDGTMNKWDEDLETTLKSLITFGYTDLGYNNARDQIFMYIDNMRVNGQGAAVNTIECVYTGQQAAGYTNRQDCQTNYNFNTEHTVPQSLFSQNPPMVSDMHHLWGTTASSNSERGNNPYGVVANPSWSVGGSKSNGSVFEPRDAHKGKAARSMLYFALRYQDFSGFIASQQALMRTWCANFLPDSVELKRNDDIYAQQHNRNPFIDHPEFLERITLLIGTGNRANVPLAYLGADTLTFSAPFPGNQTGYFVLSNQGIDTLHFSNVTFSDPQFSLQGSPNLSIPPDSARKVYVRLSPTGSGLSYNETATLSTDDATQPTVTVHLLGQSVLLAADSPLGEGFLLYPQPAQGRVALRWDNPLPASASLVLTDLQGRSLRSDRIDPGLREFGMNLEGIASGCYLLHISSDAGITCRKLIVEQ